jgi:putative sigma-54 modulation protein
MRGPKSGPEGESFMNIAIRGQNFELNESIKAYTEEKVNRLERFFDSIDTADVTLKVERNKSIENNHRVEITLRANGQVIRAEEATISMYSSIDIVVEKLERQLKKYKQKLYASMRKEKREPALPVAPEPLEMGKRKPGDDDIHVVRTKLIPMKPMSPEEAALQLELLGHDFHVFRMPDTGHFAVVYRRRDGDYGLIEEQE